MPIFCIFVNENFEFSSLTCVSELIIDQSVRISLANFLLPNRQQAIIWTNDVC